MTLFLRPLLLMSAMAALAACTVEPAPVIVQRPAAPTIVERPVDRPVYIDRPVYVDRPVYLDRPVVVERPFPAPIPVYTVPRREWVQGYYDAYGMWHPGFWRTM